ncbi:MAG TPA: hypothetical protein VGJ14_05365 [Sporichthyaceae bacterium]|jgi:hypothetical protein
MHMPEELFEVPPPPETRTEPSWPGYDEEPTPLPRAGLIARLLRWRTAA